MKKYLFILLASAAMLASCGEEILEPKTEDEATPVVFNLTANHPDATKAVKTGWEDGDVIFVFFSDTEAPKYLKMAYNGEAWTSVEMNGSTESPGALGLHEGDSGTMLAVYLPFGCDAVVSADDSGYFVFDKTYYTYYMTATLDYTVGGNVVSGAFYMEIPEWYVQFFVGSIPENEDEACSLGCDAVIPVGIDHISNMGHIALHETENKTYADDLPGYIYENGYLFSGKINEDYNYTSEGGFCYYFAMATTNSGRADLFVKHGSVLENHAAVKLPDFYSRWVPVGDGITVDLGGQYGSWYTCNYGAAVPEEEGTKCGWDDAVGAGTLASRQVFESFGDYYGEDRYWVSIHGKEGAVLKDRWGSDSFIFLPTMDDGNGYYWSLSEGGGACCLFFNKDTYSWEDYWGDLAVRLRAD